MVSGNLQSVRDLRETLQHELLVHKGLGIFSEQDEAAIISSILDNAPLSKNLKPVWEAVLKDYKDETPRIQAEELLARVAQGRYNLIDKYLNKIYTAIRKALLNRHCITDITSQLARQQRPVYNHEFIGKR